MKIALFQPDIPQNTGSFLRLCACMGCELHIIEPCGFVLDDRKLKRVAMDYGDQTKLIRHTSWERFLEAHPSRIILLTTQTTLPYTAFTFEPGDVLLLGRESSGVPKEVHEAANARVTIPMHGTSRSLNIVLAASMVLGEALRQTRSV